jgi:hypothetical protein
MPDFVPCRTPSSPQVHLYAADDSGETLCGQTPGPAAPTAPQGQFCADCARALLKRVFSSAGPGGVVEIRVTSEA